MTSLPEFDLIKPRYDQNTLSGRVKHFFQVCNPLLMFTSSAKLHEAQALQKSFKEGKIKTPTSPEMREKLWSARTLTSAILHPQTNEKIPLPFRFCSFVPVNIPIVVGMLTAKSVQLQLFWQVFNQSYNVAVNLSNGNKTNPLPKRKVALSYFAAVSVSCGISFFMGKTVAPISRFNRSLGIFARVFVPFASVSAAGASNVLLMRYNEGIDGIRVIDKDRKEVGISKNAGKRALLQVAITRAFLPVPIILLPGLIMGIVQRGNVFQHMPRAVMPFNVALITVILFLSLPVSIGLFPQEGSIDASQLEKELQMYRLTNGKLIEKAYFNKGL